MTASFVGWVSQKTIALTIRSVDRSIQPTEAMQNVRVLARACVSAGYEMLRIARWGKFENP